MRAWEELLVGTAAAGGALGLAAGAVAYAARWPTSQLFGRTLVEIPDSTAPAQHTVALTYDDGPSPRNTPALLDLLARHGVHATFFLIGNHVRRHAELARAVVAAGHTVGNHTEMHPDMARKSGERIRAELERTQHILEDTLGVRSVLFRPPYGSRRPAVLRIARSLRLTPVLWNVTAKDWEPLGAERILERVRRGMERNRARRRTSNVLLHDASHLDRGAEGDVGFASRADTVAVTAALLAQTDLRFTTVDRWLAADGDAG